MPPPIEISSFVFFKLVALGIPFGIIFVISFFLYAKNIRINGAVISSSISKMGIILSITLSFLIFREVLLPKQSIGLFLGLVSLIIYFGYFSTRKEESKRKHLWLLFILFFSQGLAEMSNKLFSYYFNPALKPVFLILLFLTAFLLTSTVLSNQNKIKKEEIIFGCLLGIPNFFSSYFLIDAFLVLQSSIVFFIFSLGTIFLVSIVSFFFFHEKISKWQAFFLFSILVSIWLIQN
jgi:drug/metabolite transporter (DMT)-like permease